MTCTAVVLELIVSTCAEHVVLRISEFLTIGRNVIVIPGVIFSTEQELDVVRLGKCLVEGRGKYGVAVNRIVPAFRKIVVGIVGYR